MTDVRHRAALDALPIAAPGSTGAIRERAFAQFQALPLPSQETEEWRYTDLSDFALDFVAARTPGTAAGRTGRAADGGPRGVDPPAQLRAWS